jgi:hypothetical protein
MHRNYAQNQITTIGTTNWRNEHQPFGIKAQDRLGHLYVLGKTGVGKSTLLLNMAIQDAEQGHGFCIIDPHGDIANIILEYIPQNRVADVLYFNAADLEHPIAYNPLAGISKHQHHLVTASLIATFRKIWSEFWGPRLEHILRFSLLTLLQNEHSTLLDIQPLLTDAEFRKARLVNITSPYILRFWYDEFEKYPAALRAEAIAPVLNKTGILAASAPVKNIIGQGESSFELRDVLDSGKILICNLSKGEIGDDATALLGSMLLTSIQTAALSRASMPEADRRPFYLYVDEMHSFVTLSFADILSEARKYGLSLFLTHQYIEQLDERVRAAIFGNVGTLISFRVGAEDARYLEREFSPVFTEADFIHLPRYSVYLKLLIDGIASKPFSADTLPLKPTDHSWKEEIIRHSRAQYGRGQLVEGEREQQVINQEESDPPQLFN